MEIKMFLQEQKFPAIKYFSDIFEFLDNLQPISNSLQKELKIYETSLSFIFLNRSFRFVL